MSTPQAAAVDALIVVPDDETLDLLLHGAAPRSEPWAPHSIGPGIVAHVRQLRTTGERSARVAAVAMSLTDPGAGDVLAELRPSALLAPGTCRVAEGTAAAGDVLIGARLLQVERAALTEAAAGDGAARARLFQQFPPYDLPPVWLEAMERVPRGWAADLAGRPSLLDQERWLRHGLLDVEEWGTPDPMASEHLERRCPDLDEVLARLREQELLFEGQPLYMTTQGVVITETETLLGVAVGAAGPTLTIAALVTLVGSLRPDESPFEELAQSGLRGVGIGPVGIGPGGIGPGGIGPVGIDLGGYALGRAALAAELPIVVLRGVVVAGGAADVQRTRALEAATRAALEMVRARDLINLERSTESGPARAAMTRSSAPKTRIGAPLELSPAPSPAPPLSEGAASRSLSRLGVLAPGLEPTAPAAGSGSTSAEDHVARAVWKLLDDSARTHATALSGLRRPVPLELVDKFGLSSLALREAGALVRAGDDRWELSAAARRLAADSQVLTDDQRREAHRTAADWFAERQADPLCAAEALYHLLTARDGVAAAPLALDVADWHFDAGRPEQAAAALDGAIELGAVGEGLERLLQARGNLRLQAGDFEQARIDFERALGVVRAEAAGSAREGRTLHGLANALTQLGRYEEALEATNAALGIKRRVLGTEVHPAYAASLHAKGNALVGLQRFDDAAAAFRLALDVEREVHGTEAHPACALAMHGLAEALLGLRQHEEAAETYRFAMDITESVHGTEVHPYFARSLAGLAGVLVRLDRLDEAANTYRQALDVLQRAHGTDIDLDFARTLGGLGEVLRKLERFNEAIDTYRLAIDITNQVYRTELNAASLPLRASLAELRLALGDPALARAEIEQAIEIARHVQHAFHLGRLLFLWAQSVPADDSARALRAAREAGEILNERLGPDHPVSTQVTAFVEQLEEDLGEPSSDDLPGPEDVLAGLVAVDTIEVELLGRLTKRLLLLRVVGRWPSRLAQRMNQPGLELRSPSELAVPANVDLETRRRMREWLHPLELMLRRCERQVARFIKRAELVDGRVRVRPVGSSSLDEHLEAAIVHEASALIQSAEPEVLEAERAFLALACGLVMLAHPTVEGALLARRLVDRLPERSEALRAEFQPLTTPPQAVILGVTPGRAMPEQVARRSKPAAGEQVRAIPLGARSGPDLPRKATNDPFADLYALVDPSAPGSDPAEGGDRRDGAEDGGAGPDS